MNYSDFSSQDVLDKIEELRNERGWSKNKLALEAMITQSTLNNLYIRNSEPKLSTLRAICGAFGITLSDFFKNEHAASERSLNLSITKEITEIVGKMDINMKISLLNLLRKTEIENK
ncbi:MAG: helix-turn-helix transcriptional regulator [Clostridia bacterium]|nr:helix-turn-helix transcriptional regulator [Clostridia bacterium]